MSESDRWILPEGVEEILSPAAWRLDRMRRQLLDLFWSWGYELMFPPFIEYLESLLTGTGHDLDLQTFKVMDQLTGRLMGIRADITPQAARIDAHVLQQSGPSRLCYLGTVLHTRPNGVSGSRSPLQVGAELFGHAGVESDIETASLMVETLALGGARRFILDLGHVGIYRSLARRAGLDTAAEDELFDILQRKAIPDLEQFLARHPVGDEAAAMLRALPDLNGGPDVLGRARNCLDGAGDEVAEALTVLERVGDRISKRYPDIELHVDLAELRGYRYHTGIVFAAFLRGDGREVARGGRYDHIGEVFGRARPATGFSADLKLLLVATGADAENETRPAGIYAPADNDDGLERTIRELRAGGERVVRALPGDGGSAAEAGCDRELKRKGNDWVVESL